MCGRFLLLFWILLSLSWGCSHFSQNQVKRSSLTVSGGRSATNSWNDSLKFKRISWYRQWSLVFDLFYAPLKEDSPFFQWVSREEKAFLDKCGEVHIVMSYYPAGGVVSDAMFLGEVERLGHERIYLDGFDKELKMHPGLAAFSLPLYNIHALCHSQKGGVAGKLALDLPGFNRVEL